MTAPRLTADEDEAAASLSRFRVGVVQTRERLGSLEGLYRTKPRRGLPPVTVGRRVAQAVCRLPVFDPSAASCAKAVALVIAPVPAGFRRFRPKAGALVGAVSIATNSWRRNRRSEAAASRFARTASTALTPATPPNTAE